MGGYFSTDKIIDNEEDYQKCQARLKRKYDIIKNNFQPHIDFLNQEYTDLCIELKDHNIRSHFENMLTLQRLKWNYERKILLKADIDTL